MIGNSFPVGSHISQTAACFLHKWPLKLKAFSRYSNIIVVSCGNLAFCVLCKVGMKSIYRVFSVGQSKHKIS